ncbi:MAG: FHA domain-containing protein [Proteobacteria bacterium]|nr:FHA domain-containing protein [Pseudomonadota bacterium]
MFLIWGEQNTEKKLGYVAEYCATCRDVRAVKVLRVGRTSHLFYVPLGRGRLLGYDGVCRRCELRFGVEITDYPAFEQDKNADLIELVRKTNPKLLAGNDAALAAWRRMNAVREPFLRYNHNLLQRYLAGARYDLPAVLALAGSLVVPFAFVYLAGRLLPKSADAWVGFGFIALFIAGLLWANRLARAEPHRFFRSRLEDALLEDLRKLSPTHEELLACLAALREYEYPIAEAVSADRLLECAAGPQPRSKVQAAAAKPAPAPKPTLVLSHAGKDYRFSPGVAEIVIGRSRENAIVLESKYVSRSHAQVAWPAGAAPRLKNLSRTGTSLRPDGATQAMACSGEVELHGSGAIGLSEDFAGAESRGDVIRYRIASG